MARKELAGLAALGALAMMANRSKKGADTSGMDTGGFEGIKNLSRRDTGMSEKEPGGLDFGSEKEPDENYAGLRTSSVGVGTVTSPRMKTPAARKSPRIGGYTSDSEQIAKSRPTNPMDELNRATNTKPMDPNSDRGPNAVTGTELDRNVDNAMNAVGGSGLKVVRNLAKGLANRKGATKLAEYSTPQLGYEPLKLGSEALKLRKKGGEIKMAKGGMARSSASSRGDGIASKGKTRGRMC